MMASPWPMGAGNPLLPFPNGETVDNIPNNQLLRAKSDNGKSMATSTVIDDVLIHTFIFHDFPRIFPGFSPPWRGHGFPRGTEDSLPKHLPTSLILPWFSRFFMWTPQFLTGWWYTYPSEKYESVSWDDDIPNISEKRDVPNHQTVKGIEQHFHSQSHIFFCSVDISASSRTSLKGKTRQLLPPATIAWDDYLKMFHKIRLITDYPLYTVIHSNLILSWDIQNDQNACSLSRRIGWDIHEQTRIFLLKKNRFSKSCSPVVPQISGRFTIHQLGSGKTSSLGDHVFPTVCRRKKVPTHWRLQIWCVFFMVSYTMWGPRFR